MTSSDNGPDSTNPPSHAEIRRRWAETYGEPVDQRPERPRGRGRLYGALVVVVGLVAGWFWLRGQAAGNQPQATDPGSTEQIARFDANKPYANTPAEGWADGADGIVLPTPVAVAGYSAAQIGTAEAQVKRVLIAAHLDNRMLVDHDPSAYLALLAPSTQGAERAVLADPAKGDDGGAVTRLMAGFHLLPTPIKVNGTMSTLVGKDGNPVVHTNYVFAFPFAPADPSRIAYSWQIVAVEHVQADFEFIADTRYKPADQGLWQSQVAGYESNVDCAAADQGYLGPDYANPQDRLQPGANTEGPNAAFDPNHPITVADTC